MAAKKTSPVAAEFRLTAFLPYKLVTVTEAVSRVFAESIRAELNLTRAEWRVLHAVEEFGTLSPTLAGQRTSMDKVQVTRAVQNLVAKGLLRQTRDPSDGRGARLNLTRKGAATLRRLVPLSIRIEAMLFEDISRADMAALNRVLTKVRTRLETIDKASSRRNEPGNPTVTGTRAR